jgi:hypothetical protein
MFEPISTTVLNFFSCACWHCVDAGLHLCGAETIKAGRRGSFFDADLVHDAGCRPGESQLWIFCIAEDELGSKAGGFSFDLTVRLCSEVQ